MAALYVSASVAVAQPGTNYTPITGTDILTTWICSGLKTGGGSASGQTINGDAMVEVSDNASELSGARDITCFEAYKVDPTVTSSAMAVTWSSAMAVVNGVALTLEGVDQTTPIYPTNGDNAGEYTTVASPSLSYDAPVGSIVVYWRNHAQSTAITWTPPSGFTQLYDVEQINTPEYRHLTVWYKEVSSAEVGSTVAATSNGSDRGGVHGVTVYQTSAAPIATSAITGTATASIDESDIVTGSETVIVTLTNDTFKAAGTGAIGSTADTQALIDGMTSAQSETLGWNNEVRDKEVVGSVVRTSNTVATITLTAQAAYNITAQETITVTVPTAVLVTGAGAIVSTPTFTIDTVAAPSAAVTGTITSSTTQPDIVAGSKTIIVTLTNDTFKAAGTGAIGSTADTQAFIDGLDSAQSETLGWNNEVRDKEVVGSVTRNSSTVATITLTAQAAYAITAQETITLTVPTAVLVLGAGPLTATPTFVVGITSVETDLILDNITFDALCSIHIQYMGTDTLNVRNTNGSNASIGSTPNGGTINFINPATLTIEGVINGSEVRLYDNETPADHKFNTELDGTESNTGTDFVYAHPGATNTITIQMMADGYEELLTDFVLSSSDQTLTLFPKVETN